MLSRKHYKAIAQAIKDNSNKDFDVVDKDRLINDLCDMFKQDNNRFDYDRFVSACD